MNDDLPSEENGGSNGMLHTIIIIIKITIMMMMITITVFAEQVLTYVRVQMLNIHPAGS